jgi:glutaredoxin
MDAATEQITNDTILNGIVCKQCKKTLPPHSAKTHLEDPTNSIFKCPHNNKVKRTGFKWGQELTKWKIAFEELQEEMESRMVDYEYILKENEELKKENEELKKNNDVGGWRLY